MAIGPSAPEMVAVVLESDDVAMWSEALIVKLRWTGEKDEQLLRLVSTKGDTLSSRVGACMACMNDNFSPASLRAEGNQCCEDIAQ
jgi:hypothetical protein